MEALVPLFAIAAASALMAAGISRLCFRSLDRKGAFFIGIILPLAGFLVLDLLLRPSWHPFDIGLLITLGFITAPAAFAGMIAGDALRCIYRRS